jgi:hypothetical protein
MKRCICLFLMLWLPVFTGSAWAMSTQMQLERLQDSTPQLATMISPEHPCHEMETDAMTTDRITTDRVDESAPSGNHYSYGKHCNGHDCFACGVCISATSYTAPAQQDIHTPSLSLANPEQPQRVFASQGYPPALKPPISA